jgi:predicted nucleic acid-binding protein
MSKKALVLDANILIRAVLGTKVRNLLMDHAESVKFFAPDSAYIEAKKYLPALLQKRGVASKPAMAVLDLLVTLVEPMELELYEKFKEPALKRIAIRDANDWPVLACAMALARYGRRMQTSLARAWRLGPRIVWSCTSQTNLSEFWLSLQCKINNCSDN